MPNTSVPRGTSLGFTIPNYIVSDAMEEYGLSALGNLPGGAIPNVYLDAFGQTIEGIDKYQR